MRLFAVLILMFAPLTAAADAVCDELWLTRNTVFDRAGYCFGSRLGKEIFDNSDCTTSAPDLGSEGDQIVAMVREIEQEFSCAVDTSIPTLAVDYIDLRRALDDLPVKTGYESMCLDYVGPALLLTAGRHPDSAIFGEILPGDNVMFLHIPVDGMEFVDLGDGRMGWVGSTLITPDLCAGGVAG